MKRIITYGSFDLLHYGHIELLRRAKAMGDYLIVALSTDEFSASKGKRAYFTYEQRTAMTGSAPSTSSSKAAARSPTFRGPRRSAPSIGRDRAARDRRRPGKLSCGERPQA